MNKYYDQEINKHQDWGGDESTSNLPVTGFRVQEFIKNTLDQKAGFLWYDELNNRYLVFSDEESKNLYVEDPLRTDLLIGTFDAPFNYDAAITLLSKPYVAILSGEKNNVVKFKFDITNNQGASVVENVLCTYTFIKGYNSKQTYIKFRKGRLPVL